MNWRSPLVQVVGLAVAFPLWLFGSQWVAYYVLSLPPLTEIIRFGVALAILVALFVVMRRWQGGCAATVVVVTVVVLVWLGLAFAWAAMGGFG